MKFDKRIILGLALALVACSNVGIPSAFQGKFADVNSGMNVSLGSGSVDLQKKDQTKATSLSVADLKVEDLLKGKAAAYVASSSDKSVDLYAVIPNAATRQAAEGLVWYEAEVTIGNFDPAVKTKVASVQLLHCAAGIVMIDTQTQRVQIGCPDQSDSLVLVRQDKKE